MPNKINRVGWRQARLWLASRIAPADVVVQDPSVTLCDCWEGLLELVMFHQLRSGPDDTREILAPVEDLLDRLWTLGAVEPDEIAGYELTIWGMQQLARMWGPEIVPPWGGSWGRCGDHGIYEAHPGDPISCPDCPKETIIKKPRPWWLWTMSGRTSRYPL